MISIADLDEQTKFKMIFYTFDLQHYFMLLRVAKSPVPLDFIVSLCSLLLMATGILLDYVGPFFLDTCENNKQQ